MTSLLLEALVRIQREYHEDLVNEEDFNFHTALWYAASSGSACIRLLLDFGANPNTGASPLGNAMDAETVRLLIASGAVVDLPDVESLTPLCYAALRGNAEVARELVAAGARIDWQHGVLRDCILMGANPEALKFILK